MQAPSAFSAVPLPLLLAVTAVVAGYFLQVAANVCGADAPSYRKGFLVSAVAAAAAFFTFDALGYALVLGTRDLTHLVLPPTYGYSDWLTEPMYLKWQVMGLVPVLRYLPIVFAICMAGILYVLMLKDHFRIVMIVFVLQWVLTVIVTSVLVFALSHVLGVFKPHAEPPPATHGPGMTGAAPPRPVTRPKQMRQAAPEQPAPAPPERPTAEGGQQASLRDVVKSYQGKLGPAMEWAHGKLDEFHGFVDPHMEPIKEATAPYTQHLPLVVQEFLDDGGWFWVLAGLTVMGLLWVRLVYRRFTASAKKKRKQKKQLIRSAEIDLEEVAGAFSEPGDHQVSVRGFPGRLRLVVMAPAASYVGDLLPEMAESLLDWIQPGLGAVYEQDTPRVIVWPRAASEGRFLDLVSQAVKVPEERGRKTPWVVLAGTTSLGRQRIYLCVAVHLDRAGYIREVRVEKDKWGELLGVQEAVAD
jgi:hypothetical protein